MKERDGAARPLGPQLRKLMDGYSAEVQELAVSTRQLVLEVLPDAEELIDRTARLVGFGYGPRYADFICTIMLNEQDIKLGIVGGADLDDPTGLLVGGGKVHRHVSINDLTDISAGIRQVLRIAKEAWDAKQGKLR